MGVRGGGWEVLARHETVHNARVRCKRILKSFRITLRARDLASRSVHTSAFTPGSATISISRPTALACGAALALLVIRNLDRRRLTLARWWIRQRLLRRRLVERDLVDAAEITRVAGVDISFVKESETDACAAAAK